MLLNRPPTDSFLPDADPGHPIFATLPLCEQHACEVARLLVASKTLPPMDEVPSDHLSDEEQCALRDADPQRYFDRLSPPLRAAASMAVMALHGNSAVEGDSYNDAIRLITQPWIEHLTDKYNRDLITPDPVTEVEQSMAAKAVRTGNMFYEHEDVACRLVRVHLYDAMRIMRRVPPARALLRLEHRVDDVDDLCGVLWTSVRTAVDPFRVLPLVQPESWDALSSCRAGGESRKLTAKTWMTLWETEVEAMLAHAGDQGPSGMIAVASAYLASRWSCRPHDPRDIESTTDISSLSVLNPLVVIERLRGICR
jgi:hypothetical protein